MCGTRYGPDSICADVARRGDAVGADVGAEIDRAAAAQAEDLAVAVAGDLQLAFGVAGVIGREQVLAAVLDPFHRPAERPRRERDQEILRIEFAAHAEAAADVGLDHGDGVLGEPQHASPACRGCGTRPWRRRYTVRCPFAASHSASRPRGSIGTAVKRCTSKRSRRT